MAKYLGKLISLKYSDRPTPIYGIVIDFNQDWTLLKYNPVDFVVDGYIIVRHKNLNWYRRSTEEKFREKVIRLKRENLPDIGYVPLDNLGAILTHMTAKFGLFQVELKSERACYIGKLKSNDGEKVVIHCLGTNGTWKGQMSFRPIDIRTISFNNDYLNSLKLVAKKRQ